MTSRFITSRFPGQAPNFCYDQKTKAEITSLSSHKFKTRTTLILILAQNNKYLFLMVLNHMYNYINNYTFTFKVTIPCFPVIWFCCKSLATCTVQIWRYKIQRYIKVPVLSSASWLCINMSYVGQFHCYEIRENTAL